MRLGRGKDLTGLIFSLLVVLYRGINASKSKRWYWVCKCECGNFVNVRSSHLLSGNTVSCGCHITKLKTDLLKNKKYNRLTILEVLASPNNRVKCRCNCECGIEIVTDKASVLSGATKSCGCLKNEQSVANFKQYHRHYRLNKTGDPDTFLTENCRKLRNSLSLGSLRGKILKRDYNTCQLCNKDTFTYLCVHHIVPLHEDVLLNYLETNLISLCSECHKLAHNRNYKTVNKEIRQQLILIIEEKYNVKNIS